MKNLFLVTALTIVSAVYAGGPEEGSVYAKFASIEKVAIDSTEFKEARAELKKTLRNPEFISRSVVAYGGMKTHRPSTSYLVIERWYGFDSYSNVIAEVTDYSIPKGAIPTVVIQKIAPAK